MPLAYLSLGSNLGDREAHLRAAASCLSQLGEIVATSSLYETEPQELREQPWFLNAALALRTELPPVALLSAMLEIERSMGRERTQPKGPRIVDLDILLYDDQVVHAPSLTIPHPAMHERLFVLVPLAEIAPQLVHPVLQRTITELRDALTLSSAGAQQVRRLTAPWFNRT